MNREGMNQGRNRDRGNHDNGKGKESHWRKGGRNHKEGNKTMERSRRIRFREKVAVFLITAILFLFYGYAVPGALESYAAVGFGIEIVYEDEIWMGWTIFESGNVSYGQAGGDGGKAYGRYQFDYRYALPDFLAYVMEEDGETYPMLGKFTGYGAGSDRLLSGAGLGSDWVKAYNADREGFSRLQDECAYYYYYIPAKRAMAARGIDLDEINDPAVKGTIYSFAIRDGANDNGVRAAWQSYRAGDGIDDWLKKMYELEAGRHPGQRSRWDGGQKTAALNRAVTGQLGDLGAVLSADGAVYQDYVKEWMEKYPGLSKAFKDSVGWSQENREWARAFRGAGDWYELYGIKGGSLDFSYGTSGGFYINDVVVNAQSLTIPDNGSSMPIVYMSQSGGQPWSNVPFGGGTIATSGCSVTSLAMVLSYLKSDVDSDGWIYPSDVVAAIAKKYGNYNRFYAGDGQSWDIFPAVAQMYQVSCNAISSASIIRELAAGKPVIMSCKPSEFTAKGHFIVLSGLTEDGYVMVNDPNAAHSSYSYKKYSISYLISCGKGWWSFAA